MEVPQYTLRPNTNAMVAPWILKLLGLAILFYGGIYFNVKYALRMSIPPIINVFIFALLGVLVVTQVILYRVKFGKYAYKFYTNRVEFEGKKDKVCLFTDIEAVSVKHKLFEKMFDTGEIQLSKNFRIGPVSNVTQIKNYLEQLVNYNAAMQQRYRMQQQQASVQQQAQPAQSGQPAQQAGQQSQQQTGGGQL